MLSRNIRALKAFFKAIIVTLTLSSCASVDQYGSRIFDGNINSQSAMNQEILLNIIRASKFQSPNFIGISQISGGQTELLSTGLPTINIGPGQTAAQHVYSISNSLSSTVTGLSRKSVDIYTIREWYARPG
jgi:hypothetical protein